MRLAPVLRGLRPWLCAGAASLSLASALAAAPPPTEGAIMRAWQGTYDQAQAAYAAGDLTVADKAGREALAQARAGGGDNRTFVASSLNLLALVRQRQQRDEDAAELLREALALSQAAADAHANTAALALNLGCSLEALSRPDAAREAYDLALTHADQAPAGDPQAAAARRQALQALARLYTALGRAEDAARYNRRLLDAGSMLPTAMQADALELQAQLQLRQGDLGAARQSFERALALQEERSAPDTAALLRSLGGLTDVLGRLGQDDAAEPLHRRAVALLESAQPQSPALAAHLNELGMWHLQRKEYPAAETLLGRALAIVEAQSPQGLDSARITANLAQSHEARSDDATAQALFRQALAIYETHAEQPEALLGQAQALNYLAGQDYRRRRIAQAEAQFLKALALTEQAAGPRSMRLLPLLDNLATLYRSQQRAAQAAAYAARAQALREPEGR